MHKGKGFVELTGLEAGRLMEARGQLRGLVLTLCLVEAKSLFSVTTLRTPGKLVRELPDYSPRGVLGSGSTLPRQNLGFFCGLHSDAWAVCQAYMLGFNH